MPTLKLSLSVDLNSLLRLSSGGIAQYPPSELATLADWCWDRGETTGDARYCSLSRSLTHIAKLFEDDQGVPGGLINALDQLLSSRVSGILEADTAEIGASLARSLREEIVLELLAQ
jgi:hypothetical protein